MELQAEDIKLTGSNPAEKDINEPDTLVETLEGLKKQGFTYDFNLTAHALELYSDEGIKLTLNPEDFSIVKVFRFEGMSNPSDTSILYAIESNTGLKGTLVSSYGVYADAMSNEMIGKLDTRSSIASFHPENTNS
ncbi:hypothetical protein [Dyadobacter frigoris]|uniref:Phosphoribosylpyrophosphate synthetase n=1 Tax=Dyadobacter frigoris TaxID=2576211 RepID=A0A4V6BK81_9BACT|nr:hypothetical protein [Dyadobacter frigoris]TKT91763.1 hypothetical protein FDK13_11425 [Dyadobacter frigoris]GLU55590.1 hypothetical protein Dfri01_50510 [Dyadobacter frigoris]